ncbi:MAG: T9SS type A sorting domain-containing protein [Bacteroidota bacterium]
MKKLILLFLVLVLKFAPAKAQWVTIPDPNFVTYLQANYPSCMNGNQMDTTCAGIVNATSLDVSLTFAISDLNGVQYFDNLLTLDCSDNFLSSLPTLPNSLTILNCYGNQLNSLPTLPNSLLELYCFENLLSSLPVLPNSLTYIDCYDNQLTSLPTLPSSLNVLICYSNQLSSLPILPDSLTVFQCSYNQLSSLPALPNSLTVLNCGYNQLSGLPALPDSLTGLLCSNNQLSSLPALPNSLTVFNCSYNQLNSLPSVPNLMQSFVINNNNISCLVNLPAEVINAALIFNNPFTCVPNQTAYSLGLPLCIDADPVNNPNNCPSSNITGAVYTDLNVSCSYNAVDLNSQNVPVKLYDNQNNLLAQSFIINGVYSFANLLQDTFQVKIDTTNFPITMACGQSSIQIVTLDSANQTIQNINFPVVCNAGNDVYVLSVSRSGWVFPGQIHTLETNITDNETWFNIACDEGNTSGIVTINVIGPVSFAAPAPGALTPTVSGNTFTYTISDFNTLNPNSFGLRLLTDTTAQATDQICVHVEISLNPTDADTSNNVYDFCYNVVNSYDPNMKEVYPVNVLPGYDDWFTYTIHFQNTGNAPAFNIRLRDTLDTQLDLNTFEVLGYSHPANVGISGNILTVRFNNIMLPDSTSDYEGSMGYFQYRIKPTPNLPNGSQIRNTCYIYFDYNAPIITNTTENNFDITVPVKSIVTTENSFSLFPNPSTGVFTFIDIKNINSVEVYSILGEKILSQTNQKTINLNGFSKGIYFARINGMQVVKLVNE